MVTLRIRPRSRNARPSALMESEGVSRLATPAAPSSSCRDTCGEGGGGDHNVMVLLIMDSLQGGGILCRESDNVQVKIRQVTMLGATETTSGFHCFTGDFVGGDHVDIKL